jgi:hypothetical protein
MANLDNGCRDADGNSDSAGNDGGHNADICTIY